MPDFTFDRYNNLDPITQLEGLTIEKVEPYEATDSEGSGFTVTFRDGRRLKFFPTYDDSDVQIKSPDA